MGGMGGYRVLVGVSPCSLLHRARDPSFGRKISTLLAPGSPYILLSLLCRKLFSVQQMSINNLLGKAPAQEDRTKVSPSILCPPPREPLVNLSLVSSGRGGAWYRGIDEHRPQSTELSVYALDGSWLPRTVVLTKTCMYLLREEQDAETNETVEKVQVQPPQRRALAVPDVQSVAELSASRRA